METHGQQAAIKHIQSCTHPASATQPTTAAAWTKAAQQMAKELSKAPFTAL
jgi:hypothetical protein